MAYSTLNTITLHHPKMIGRRMTLPIEVARLARTIAADYWEAYQSHLASCEEDRKQGFRPHYCEHGTNLWTDYDNICGPCEDGYSMGDGVYRRRVAISKARLRIKRYNAMVETRAAMRQCGIDFDAKGFNEMLSATLTGDFGL